MKRLTLGLITTLILLIGVWGILAWQERKPSTQTPSSKTEAIQKREASTEETGVQNPIPEKQASEESKTSEGDSSLYLPIDHYVEPSKDISTWKTYRNEEFGFEFKYPSEWRVSYSDDRVFGRGIYVGVYSNYKYINNEILLTIIYPENIDKIFNQILSDKGSQFKKAERKVTHTTINNIPVRIIETIADYDHEYDPSIGKYHTISYVFGLGKITLDVMNGDANGNYNEIDKKILNSVKRLTP